MAEDDTEITGGDGGGELAGNMRALDDRTRGLTSGANAFARAITAAFAQGATGAKSFDTVLKSLGQRLSTLSLNLALKPLTGALSSGIDQLFKGIAGAFTGSSRVEPNAKGGILSSPTYFPIGAGRTGLAGEAGPEAIMPLTRGPDGRLGVAASGGGAASVTVNIATPDADSFRRSETYLTGLIARAVARGQRGL
jgi:phage-related minor tail protein